MWNSNRYAAMAIAVGLAVTAATPASAWCPGYGAAYGYGGYGDYGYAGTFTYGWPYATNLGFSNYGAYGAAYGYGGWGGYYGAAYGYGGGWPPFYSSAGWGCGRSAHRLRGHGYAVASYSSHRAPVLAARATARGPRLAATQRNAAIKPVQTKIAYRAGPKLARIG